MVNPAYLIGAGASVGAILRYATGQYVGGVAGNRSFPYGTFTVNVVGSFVLALITVLGAGAEVGGQYSSDRVHKVALTLNPKLRTGKKNEEGEDEYGPVDLRG